jgi:hypothetical protein
MEEDEGERWKEESRKVNKTLIDRERQERTCTFLSWC